MSDDVRGFGYVIRWPVNAGYEYQGMHTTPNRDLQRAEVMSLAVASKFLRGGGYESAEIARVRRVAGEDQWVPLDETDLANLAIETRFDTKKPEIEPASTWFAKDDRYPSRFVKRIPGEPRWEMVDE